MNNAIREQYRADLARQITETGKDQVRRSLFHFVNAGKAVDTALISEDELKAVAGLVLNER